MKILVLTSTYSRRENDTEPKFVDNLCHYLSLNNEVHVVAPHAPGIPTRESMNGIPVFRFRYCFENWQTLAYDGGILPSLKQNPLRALLIPLFLFSECLLTVKLMREHHYDVIHAHWIIPQGLVAVLARAFAPARPAVVVTSHGGDLFALRGALLARLKRWIIARAEQLTVVSSAMKSRAAALRLAEVDHICVIPMGMDSRELFCPPASAAPRTGLLFIGRLVEKKGVEYLLAAMPQVLQQHPQLRLTIVGDGPLRNSLVQQCATLGIAGQVRFTGSIANRQVPDYLRAAAITVFPSVVTSSGDQEGTPVAIMEALACACPTIVSDYPGVRDIINEGENGLIVEQKSPASLSRAITTLLEDAQLRERLGNAARESVQRDYDWLVISARFLALFQSITKVSSQAKR
ncbi:MAG: glycosyltransferase family 4 protein [Halioglobus sp.]